MENTVPDRTTESLLVYVNDHEHRVPAGSTVGSLLSTWSPRGARGLAVAVGDVVVPRATWATRPLQAGDRVLIIQASQGG